MFANMFANMFASALNFIPQSDSKNVFDEERIVRVGNRRLARMRRQTDHIRCLGVMWFDRIVRRVRVVRRAVSWSATGHRFAQDAVNRRDRRQRVSCTNSLEEQLLTDLPRKQRAVLFLVLPDLRYDQRRRHSWLAAPCQARQMD